MEILSGTDALLFGGLAFGATAYVSQNYLQSYLVKQASEPLIPAKKSSNIDKATSASLPYTRNIVKALIRSNRQCVIFYGSQTGTAERLAIQFSKEANSRFGISCLVADLDDYDCDDLLSLPHDKAAIFLLATYGEGEPTDNAVSFNRYLQKLETMSNSLSSSLRFTGFGLGNSSYQFYNQMIKRLDSNLTRHGAQCIGTVGFGDDGKGTLTDDFLSWMTPTLPILADTFGHAERAYVYNPSFELVRRNFSPTVDTLLGEPNKRHLRNKRRGPWTLANPYPAPIVAAHDLCLSGNRQVLHIDMDLSQSTLTYEAGDHLAVRPMNSDLEVERFLRVFNLTDIRHEEIDITGMDPSLKVPVPSPTTYDAIARHYLDICAPVSRQLLTILATFAPNDAIRSYVNVLSSQEQIFRQRVVLRCRNIAQVLEEHGKGFTWSRVPFSALLEHVPIMKPRYYSISSSPLMNKKAVSITTAIVREESSESSDNFRGVSTSYLAALSSRLQSSASAAKTTHQVSGPRERYVDPTALVSIRRSKFKLPKDCAVPIIMIGPGTGVAPFRGFVQNRAQQARHGKTVGRTLLFYGCRRPDHDFLYRDEWQGLAQELGADVFSMHTAFSRDPTQPKTYVQDLFDRDGCAEKIRNLILRENAYIYVCGDAQRMARDVFGRVTEVLAQDETFSGNGEGLDGVRRYLKQLKDQGRWLEDTW